MVVWPSARSSSQIRAGGLVMMKVNNGSLAETRQIGKCVFSDDDFEDRRGLVFGFYEKGMMACSSTDSKWPLSFVANLGMQCNGMVLLCWVLPCPAQQAAGDV
ncbi:hypothetical protein Dimus_026141 [Dionaea muscipula]